MDKSVFVELDSKMRSKKFNREALEKSGFDCFYHAVYTHAVNGMSVNDISKIVNQDSTLVSSVIEKMRLNGIYIPKLPSLGNSRKNPNSNHSVKPKKKKSDTTPWKQCKVTGCTRKIDPKTGNVYMCSICSSTRSCDVVETHRLLLRP